MPTSVLAFEPSSEYRSIINCLLESEEGYSVAAHERYEDFLDDLAAAAPNLLLVSFVDLPDGGEETLAALRRERDVPIMAFVDGPEQTKAALRNGADYDLPKPFDPEVFKVAVEAVMRRSGSTGLLPSPAHIQLGDLKVYPDRRTVERNGRRQSLSQTEWQLLAFLLAHPGKTFSRRELAAGAWGPGYASRSGQAELYVSRVRRKVERDPQRPQLIQTVRNAGYRLVADGEGFRL